MVRIKVDVIPTTPAAPGVSDEPEVIPLSALNHYLFCPRRAALIHVDGVFEDNQHTLRAEIVHEHSDLSGYEVVKGVTLLRALPVWSERLGLSGKCDIVEAEFQPASNTEALCAKRLYPVEFKLGKRRRWENDDVQLCAQALCLEEMFGVGVPRGAVFHASSKRRREVEFTADLRQRTEQAARDLRCLVRDRRVPAAVYKPACEECSLFDLCQPRIAESPARIGRLTRQLFEI